MKVGSPNIAISATICYVGWSPPSIIIGGAYVGTCTLTFRLHDIHIGSSFINFRQHISLSFFVTTFTCIIGNGPKLTVLTLHDDELCSIPG